MAASRERSILSSAWSARPSCSVTRVCRVNSADSSASAFSRTRPKAASTLSTCARTSGGIFAPGPEARVASQTCSSWASRARSPSTCARRFVRLRFQGANSSRIPRHSRSKRRSISRDGSEASTLEVSSRRRLVSCARKGCSCRIVAAARSEERFSSTDCRLANAASAWDATSANGIAEALVPAAGAETLLVAAWAAAGLAFANHPPMQSSQAAVTKGNLNSSSRCWFVIRSMLILAQRDDVIDFKVLRNFGRVLGNFRLAASPAPC